MTVLTSNMYGLRLQTYTLGNNVSYPADGNGFIANVAQGDVQVLVDQGCISEAQWLSVRISTALSGPHFAHGIFGSLPGQGKNPRSGLRLSLTDQRRDTLAVVDRMARAGPPADGRGRGAMIGFSCDGTPTRRKIALAGPGTQGMPVN